MNAFAPTPISADSSTSTATNYNSLHLSTDDLYLSGTFVNTGSTFTLKTAGMILGAPGFR